MRDEVRLPWGYVSISKIEAALDQKENALANALASAFLWHLSPQGHDFWAEEEVELSVEGQAALQAILTEARAILSAQDLEASA